MSRSACSIRTRSRSIPSPSGTPSSPSSGLTAPAHHDGVLVYPFADGWFVIAADDRSLIGSRLVAIGSTPVAQVEAALRPLVPADNESGKLDGLQFPMSNVEILHGLGIVKDPAFQMRTSR